MKSKKQLIRWGFGIAIGLAILLFLFYLRADDRKRVELESAIATAILSSIVTILVSGVGLAIIRDLEERSKAWVTRRDLLYTDLTKGTAKLYASVKRARRLLRASTLNNQIEKSIYDTQLKEINDLQLDFEQYKRAAKMEVQISGLAPSTVNDLRMMEQYLGDLVTEFELAQAHLERGAQTIAFEKLPQLDDFLSRSHSSKFHSEFVTPYHRAADLIAQELAATKFDLNTNPIGKEQKDD